MRHLIQREIGDEPFELGVLFFELFEASGLVDFEAAEPGTFWVHSTCSTWLGSRCVRGRLRPQATTFDLFEDADNLLRAPFGLFHCCSRCSYSSRRTLLPNGSS